jgi:hypothetical protein
VIYDVLTFVIEVGVAFILGALAVLALAYFRRQPPKRKNLQ